LITGETGSGKELVAKMIHSYSTVSTGPYAILNSSCIPSTLAESILFGTLPGSYTGAVDVKGLFEEANHGSLFLDEIGELDSGLQAKFLRVLEDKQVSRLGSHLKKRVEFRLITATNRSLNQLVSAGLFREDLFYRLEVFRLETPPLRAHPEDIPLLSRGILEKNHKVLSNDAIDKLIGYSWPGNVRQLFHCLLRACASCDSDIIPPEKILF
jgi:transcriptional regulator with PAS, ATPase and Fis domain